MKNEDEKEEEPEVVRQREIDLQKRKMDDLTNELKEKLNMQDFDLEVTKFD